MMQNLHIADPIAPGSTAQVVLVHPLALISISRQLRAPGA